MPKLNTLLVRHSSVLTRKLQTDASRSEDRSTWRLQKHCLPFVFLVIMSVVSAAQTFTMLAQFDGANGGTPVGPLVQGFNGDLYGTSEFAGSHGGTNFGGTAFSITTGGTLTTVYNFCVGGSGNCTDGYNPTAGLARDASGNFYGTASSGGAHGPFLAYGTGFKVTPSGTRTTLYSFCAQSGCSDGTNPNGGVILASNGNLYGTTVSGGTHSSGTVFKMTTGGTLTTLHNFCSLASCADGSQPQASPIQASDGNFYGTTYAGGTNSKGIVFKMTANGTLTTLYPFCSLASCADGAQPYAKLVQGADGILYGTTTSGGKFNKGTVFKITTAGKLTTLYSFCTKAACADGETPLGALIQATDGNFYGTTFLGGAKNQGTIFELKTPSALTTLYSFCPQSGCPDGANPIAGLVQDTNGEFYGTAMDGGSAAFSCDGAGNGGTSAGCGTVFSLSVGLKAFISLLSTSGKVGSKVGILGDGFSSSSVVKFNGVTATSTLTEPGLLTATVPAGASDGFVTVTTGATTLTSTQKYVVHNSWGSGKAMPAALFAPAATGVINNKIYVVGGFTMTSVIANNQIYNPTTNSWSAGAAIPTTTADGASAVVNNILYVFGGSQDGTTVTNAVWAYNQVTNTWSSKAAMPTARASAAAAVKSNIIYVVGGTDGVNRFNTMESYNPATNTWATKAPLLVGKSEASVGLVGTTIVAADGYTSSMDTGDNEGYNSSTNAWSALTSDPTPRHEACTGSTGTALYLAGGSNNSGTSLSLTESFSVTSNKWTTLTSMPLAVTFPGSAIDTGLLYCFGGSDRNSQFQGKVYNYVQIYQP